MEYLVKSADYKFADYHFAISTYRPIIKIKRFKQEEKRIKKFLAL